MELPTCPATRYHSTPASHDRGPNNGSATVSPATAASVATTQSTQRETATSDIHGTGRVRRRTPANFPAPAASGRQRLVDRVRIPEAEAVTVRGFEQVAIDQSPPLCRVDVVGHVAPDDASVERPRSKPPDADRRRPALGFSTLLSIRGIRSHMSEQDAADEEGEDRAGEGTDGSAENGVSEGDATPDAADGAADSTGDTDHEGTDAEDGEATVDEDLVERVAESDPETVATELAALRERVDGLEAELDERDDEIEDLESELKRKQADFQNYKKRMEKRREQEKQRATEDLVERLVDVRDNLVRALDQEEEGADAEDIRGGVETTLSQFDRVLEDENVDIVDPEPGEEVDPHTHEVLMRVDSDQPEGTIDEVHRPGYVMAEKVLQTAQVTVSDGDEGDGRTRSETV